MILARRTQTLLLASTLCSWSCISTPAICRSFAIPASHMTNRISQPFVVRDFVGRVLPAEHEAESEQWPYGTLPFNFEVHGPNGLTVNVSVEADGTFRLPGLRSGKYCFRTSSEYLQGYEGTVIIDRAADPNATIEFRVALGV